MLNKEKFAKDLIEIAIDGEEFGFSGKEIFVCFDDSFCNGCKFNKKGSCSEARRQWANSEYKEPKTFTDDEKALIRVLDKVKYVVRDYKGFILLMTKKPMKNNYEWFGRDAMYCTINLLTSATFSAIKWEDDEPTSREEILGE